MQNKLQLITSGANSLLLALLLLAPTAYSQPQPQSQPDGSPMPVPQLRDDKPADDRLAQGTLPAEAEVIDSNASDAVKLWLGKLSEAVTTLEYRGLVTFEHTGMLETLQVVHAMRNGEQVELVRYLSGEPRELISSGHNASCRRDSSPLARAALWSKAGQEDVQRLYYFLLRGEERIADRDTVVIDVRPRDQHRLGMVINLDKQTGLPLKSMLVGSQGRVLERYQFVQLDLSPVSENELQPRSSAPHKVENDSTCGSIVSRWQLRWLPRGFKPIAARELPDGEMLVFSDGLSVFTVFVQQLGPEMNFNGRAIRGATVAYMDHLEVADKRYTVTVVGEIPDTTAQLVARAVAGKN